MQLLFTEGVKLIVDLNSSRPEILPNGATVPGALTQALYLLNTLSALAKEIRTHLLLGSSEKPKFGSGKFSKRNWFNSAFLRVLS